VHTRIHHGIELCEFDVFNILSHDEILCEFINLKNFIMGDHIENHHGAKTNIEKINIFLQEDGLMWWQIYTVKKN